MLKNKLIIISVIFFCGLYAQNQTILNGSVEYFYMNRLSNSSIINIPFRVLDINAYHKTDNLDVIANLSLEYRGRKDTDFIVDTDLEDFSMDIRELYLAYYLKNGEIRIGKQVHSWGNVDENSPIDNLNGYDYYYLLLGGAEKKLGCYSMGLDYYFLAESNLKFSFVFSPLHNTSRVPINDPDYPLGITSGLSLSPETIVLNDNNPYETAFNFRYSFNFGDIS